MAKAHLIASPVPIVAGQTYKMPCGVEVRNARHAFLWDETEMGIAILPTRGVCRACWEIVRADIAAVPQYIAGLIDGREGE